MTEDPSLYTTRDFKLILLFIAEKAPIVKTEKNQHNRTIFTFKREDVQPFIDLWVSGKPIPIDIRDMFNAFEIFNIRVHDEI